VPIDHREEQPAVGAAALEPHPEADREGALRDEVARQPVRQLEARAAAVEIEAHARRLGARLDARRVDGGLAPRDEQLQQLLGRRVARRLLLLLLRQLEAAAVRGRRRGRRRRVADGVDRRAQHVEERAQLVHRDAVAAEPAHQLEQLVAHDRARRGRGRLQPAQQDVDQVQLRRADVQVVLRGDEEAAQPPQRHRLLALGQVRQQVHQLVHGVPPRDALLARAGHRRDQVLDERGRRPLGEQRLDVRLAGRRHQVVRAERLHLAAGGFGRGRHVGCVCARDDLGRGSKFAACGAMFLTHESRAPLLTLFL